MKNIILMSDKYKQVKASAGLAVGYIIAALVHVLFYEKSFIEAITDQRLILIFAGILVSIWIIERQKKKEQ